MTVDIKSFGPEMTAVTDYRISLSEEISRKLMHLPAPMAIGLVLIHISTVDLETICRFLQRNKYE